MHTTSRKDAIDILAKKRAEIASAKNIVIIGAGPVGIGICSLQYPTHFVELSGEIKMAHPDKNVTIVHGGRLPVSDAFPDYFREKAVASIEEHGVKIILNEKVDIDSIGGKGEITLMSGKTLPADLVVLSILEVH